MISAKKEGSSGVVDMIPLVIIIAVCGIMFLYFAREAKYLDICNSLNNSMRKTILKMESTRGLTQADMDNLTAELEGYGLLDVTYDGTTLYNSNLRPGDEISLYVKCRYSANALNTDGLLDAALLAVNRDIKVSRHSVVMK